MQISEENGKLYVEFSWPYPRKDAVSPLLRDGDTMGVLPGGRVVSAVVAGDPTEVAARFGHLEKRRPA
jgi:hypothetical protein